MRAHRSAERYGFSAESSARLSAMLFAALLAFPFSGKGHGAPPQGKRSCAGQELHSCASFASVLSGVGAGAESPRLPAMPAIFASASGLLSRAPSFSEKCCKGEPVVIK